MSLLKGRLWLVAALGVAVWVLAFTPIGRGLEWDEATFFSQSGDLSGVEAPAAISVASREHGTALLIAVTRLFAADLPGMRLVWTLLSVGLVVLAFREVSRAVGEGSGLVGLALFTTAWAPVIFFGSFFGSLLGAAASLLATGLFLRLRSGEGSAVRVGILFGLALAAAFWMRHLESLLVALVLGASALVWRPQDVWRRWPGVLSAIASFILVFVAPWTAYTVSRWGSVPARFLASRRQSNAQGGNGHPFGLHNGVDEYWRMLTGVRLHYRVAGPTPDWVIMVAGGGLLLILIAIVGYAIHTAVMGRRFRASAAGMPGASGLLFALAVVSFGLFFFFSQILKERYLLYGMIFTAVLAGQAITGLWTRLGRRRPDARFSRWSASAAAIIGILWVVSQATIASTVQEGRREAARWDEAAAVIVRQLANGRDCVLLGQLSKPQVQARSGCITKGANRSTEVLRRRLTRPNYSEDDAVFVLWRPGRDSVADLVGDWPSLEDPGGRPGTVLSYRLEAP